jgi:uncharacterized membrane protein YdbT with pleckstrin-like domain
VTLDVVMEVAVTVVAGQPHRNGQRTQTPSRTEESLLSHSAASVPQTGSSTRPPEHDCVVVVIVVDVSVVAVSVVAVVVVVVDVVTVVVVAV